MLTKWCVRLITLVAMAATNAVAQVVVLTPTSTVFDPAGGTMVFNASVRYSASPSVLAFSASIPSGWSYVSTGTGGPGVSPAAGATGTLEWIYVTPPPNPISFNFTVAYPANLSGVQPLTSTSLTRDTAGSAGVTAPGPSVTLAIPSNTSVWGGGTGDWNTAANWTPSTVPANSGTTTYAARITAGTATINAPVTVNDLQLVGGTVNNLSSLTLAGSGSSWEAGALSGIGQLIVAPGAFLTASTSASHDFNQQQVTNQGQFIWNGSGNLRSGGGGTFVNAANAVFVDTSSSGTTTPVRITTTGFTGNFTFTNSGTYQKSGSGETSIEIPFTNSATGNIVVNAGNLHFGTGLTIQGGIINVATGATTQIDSGLTLSAGKLIGGGTVNGNVTASGTSFISPGDPIGTLTITGNLTLLGTSQLMFDIANSTPSTGYDRLVVQGTATLGGTFSFSMQSTPSGSLLPTDTLTLISAPTITGTFSGLPNGTRIFATNSVSSFVISYSSTAVTLSAFQAVPEPSTWVLMCGGAGSLFVSLWRRRRADPRRPE